MLGFHSGRHRGWGHRVSRICTVCRLAYSPILPIHSRAGWYLRFGRSVLLSIMGFSNYPPGPANTSKTKPRVLVASSFARAERIPLPRLKSRSPHARFADSSSRGRFCSFASETAGFASPSPERARRARRAHKRCNVQPKQRTIARYESKSNFESSRVCLNKIIIIRSSGEIGTRGSAFGAHAFE